jgi:hypothetical protein
VVRFVAGDGDDRGGFSLTLLHDTNNPYPRPPYEVVQSYDAVPLDGCDPLFERVEPTPPGCEQPWTRLHTCCVPLVHPVPDAGIGDAGIGDAGIGGEDAG